MKHIKNKNDKKKFLIDLYTTLESNLKFDTDTKAIIKLIDRMFYLDKKIATTWIIELINKYSKQGLDNLQNGFCKDMDIDNLIKSLLSILIRKIEFREVILLVKNNIQDYLIRSYIWRILFTTKDNLVINFLEECFIANNLDNAYDLINTIIENKNHIDKAIFDSSLFIYKIIESFTNGPTSNEETTFLYSLKEYLTNDFDKAIFDSYFLDYILN